jgi:hypothetical protein
VAGDEVSEPRLPRWKSWSRGLLWVFMALMFGVVVAAIVEERLFVLILALPGMLALGGGAWEILAPRQFLAWREADTPSSGWERDALEGFDDALGVSRDESGEYSDSAVRRVRYIGVGVSVFGALMVIAAVAADRAGYFA